MEAEYLAQMTEKERLAMEIARRMLGPSFNLTRSHGYLKFLASARRTAA